MSCFHEGFGADGYHILHIICRVPALTHITSSIVFCIRGTHTQLRTWSLCIFLKTYSPQHNYWRHGQDWKEREGHPDGCVLALGDNE